MYSGAHCKATMPKPEAVKNSSIQKFLQTGLHLRKKSTDASFLAPVNTPIQTQQLWLLHSHSLRNSLFLQTITALPSAADLQCHRASNPPNEILRAGSFANSFWPSKIHQLAMVYIIANPWPQHQHLPPNGCERTGESPWWWWETDLAHKAPPNQTVTTATPQTPKTSTQYQIQTRQQNDGKWRKL